MISRRRGYNTHNNTDAMPMVLLLKGAASGSAQNHLDDGEEHRRCYNRAPARGRTDSRSALPHQIELPAVEIRNTLGCV